MKGLYTALLAFTAVQATPTGNSDSKALNARAVDLKVQYYKDGGCSDYAVSIWPGTSNSCYGYSYSNTNSANIVTCGGRGVACTCYMFEQDNSTGPSCKEDLASTLLQVLAPSYSCKDGMTTECDGNSYFKWVLKESSLHN
ncbi:hypothetical protein FGLOB1_6237 [Fusarium globosum]|uniref:Uncharacterized protein n=1 Tax=Fusarium globosum TaxID=78864 RepID=A0A8H6DB52_9HYPO|nr:hypothetical protein FGLOB1_6237 [Fusarium globosum]